MITDDAPEAETRNDYRLASVSLEADDMPSPTSYYTHQQPLHFAYRYDNSLKLPQALSLTSLNPESRFRVESAHFLYMPSMRYSIFTLHIVYRALGAYTLEPAS